MMGGSVPLLKTMVSMLCMLFNENNGA